MLRSVFPIERKRTSNRENVPPSHAHMGTDCDCQDFVTLPLGVLYTSLVTCAWKLLPSYELIDLPVPMNTGLMALRRACEEGSTHVTVLSSYNLFSGP